MESLVAQMNEEARGPRTDLVLFEDAVDHVARVTRTLSTERGSALLVGVGGSGKQSLARLAAGIAGARVFQIAAAKGYGVAAFLEDIKVRSWHLLACLAARRYALI